MLGTKCAFDYHLLTVGNWIVDDTPGDGMARDRGSRVYRRAVRAASYLLIRPGRNKILRGSCLGGGVATADVLVAVLPDAVQASARLKRVIMGSGVPRPIETSRTPDPLTGTCKPLSRFLDFCDVGCRDPNAIFKKHSLHTNPLAGYVFRLNREFTDIGLTREYDRPCTAQTRDLSCD
jgi:hypothetical protein